jgi:hypothetical protein
MRRHRFFRTPLGLMVAALGVGIVVTGPPFARPAEPPARASGPPNRGADGPGGTRKGTPDEVAPDGPADQPPDGPRVEILNVVVQEHRANLGRLQTWTGTALIADKTSRNGQLESKTKYDVAFAVDRVHDAFRWDRRTVETARYENGKEVPGLPEGLWSESGMRKGDDFYRLGPRKPDARGQIASVNTPAAIHPGPASTDFDPLSFFGAHGQDVAERFRYFYEYSGNPALTWKTTRDHDRLTVESDVGVSVNRYVVDLAQGANLVEWYLLDRDATGKEPQGETKMTWEHEQVAGVWVPKKVVYYDEDRRRGTRSDRTIDWRDQRVNEPLPADTFSLATLGVRPGDQVVDMRSGARAVVPSDEPRSAARPRPDGKDDRLRRWLLAAGGVLLALLAAAWLARTYVRRRRGGAAGGPAAGIPGSGGARESPGELP